ncbi:MAG: hypothetical protein E6Y86_08735 [Slackia sp.]|nr:hypothetical protein [Slackia sp.]
MSDLVKHAPGLASEHLAIFPQVVTRGLIRIDRRAVSKNSLKLEDRITSNGYVGLIPIAPQLSIWVRPRVPFRNIDYMAKKYGGIISEEIRELRSYMTSDISSKSMEDILYSSFLDRVEEIVTRGEWKGYLPKERRSGSLANNLDTRKTIDHFHSRGIRYKAVSKSFIKTADIIPNKILKLAITLIARKGDPFTKTSSRAAGLLQYFQDVDIESTSSFLQLSELYANKTPDSKHLYSHTLPLAKAIILSNSVDLSSSRGELFMDTLLIEMSRLFENYVRALLTDSIQHPYTVLDGNKLNPPIKLFADEFDRLPSSVKKETRNASGTTGKNVVDPDILIVSNGHTCKAVIDVKYKPIRGSFAAKRSDLEQVVTYATRLGLNRAITVHPCQDSAEAGLYYSGNIGNVEIFAYLLDLSRSDLSAQESIFTETIRTLLDN